MTTPTHDALDELATGYQASQIVLAANRLGLFRALADRILDAEVLAAALEASPRGTRILSDALVALGLLERVGDGYRNSELARRHLLPDSPEPRADMLRHAARLYARWGGLYDAVKTGEPVDDGQLDLRLLGDETDFARAMADIGRRSAAATSAQLDLGGCRRLLEIGGGPAIYAIEFARRWPQLLVVVLDREEAVAEARRNVRETSLEDRIELVVGDAFEAELGGPYDAVFVSNVVHIYSAADNQRLIERCAAVLAPGGRLVLKDFFLDDDRRSPPGGVLFAVNMLVNTAAGDCYTVSEAHRWLELAGLEPREVRDIASRSRLLIAAKPDV